MNRIFNFSKLILTNFFLIILLIRLLEFIGIELYLRNLFILDGFIMGLFCMNRMRWYSFDYIILLYIIYLLSNGLFIDYQNYGLYQAIIGQWAMIFFYFWGRGTSFGSKEIFRKMKYPLLFAMICGLLFYFFEPAWYVSMKEAQLKEGAMQFTRLEIYRLSSFWAHPYQIAYAAFFYSAFLLYVFFTDRNIKASIIIQIVICQLILGLAQIRVGIFMFILWGLLLTFTNTKNKDIKHSRIFLLLLLSLGFIMILSIYVKKDSIEYMTEHVLALTKENAMMNRFEQTSGGNLEVSFWGEGLGKYGNIARTYGKFAIVDNEYQNHYAELGYVGLTLLLLIIFLTFIKLLRKHDISLDSCMIIFFVLSMMGASVLSNNYQYGYLFWFFLGRIWKKYNIQIA